MRNATLLEPGLPIPESPTVPRITEKEDSRPDMLTYVSRVFAAWSSGFPVENLLEPDAGAVGRTAAANPFEAYFGVADLSALATLSCALRSVRREKAC